MTFNSHIPWHKADDFVDLPPERVSIWAIIEEDCVDEYAAPWADELFVVLHGEDHNPQASWYIVNPDLENQEQLLQQGYSVVAWRPKQLPFDHPHYKPLTKE